MKSAMFVFILMFTNNHDQIWKKLRQLRCLGCCDQFFAEFFGLFILSAYNMKETRFQCTLNGYLLKINGFLWFRIDFHNFRKTKILKLFEFLEENFKKIKALYKWYLVAATISLLKFIVCVRRNALMDMSMCLCCLMTKGLVSEQVNMI